MRDPDARKRIYSVIDQLTEKIGECDMNQSANLKDGEKWCYYRGWERGLREAREHLREILIGMDTPRGARLRGFPAHTRWRAR